MKTDTEFLERAFRRGFHHGLHSAIDAIEAGATREDLINWANREIATWRNTMEGSWNLSPDWQAITIEAEDGSKIDFQRFDDPYISRLMLNIQNAQD